MAESQSPEQRIKDLAKKSGAIVTGIASVEEFDKFAPEHYRPTDLLVGAKSIIVFGGPMTLSGAYHSPSSRVRGFNRNFATIRERISLTIAQFIESEYGQYSIYQPGGEKIGLMPFFSVKLAAELAGLGSRSMAAGILMHPEHGMLSYSYVITTMELKADGPMTEPACPHPACVKQWEARRKIPCLDACPDCLSGELENGRMKRLRYNRHLCMTRAQAFGVFAFQKALWEIMKEPDLEKRKMMALGGFFSRSIHQVGFSSELVGQCSMCIMRCPLMAKQLNLKPAKGGKE